MTEEEWRKKLEEAGYNVIGVHTFDPDAVSEEHTHDVKTAHVIIEGDLIVKDKSGDERVYHEGERFEFPAGTTHTATPGPNGCRLMVGIIE